MAHTTRVTRNGGRGAKSKLCCSPQLPGDTERTVTVRAKHRMSQYFTAAEVNEFRQTFALFDQDGSGSIDVEELAIVAYDLGVHMSMAEYTALLQSVDEDGTGEIEFPEFLTLMAKMMCRDGKKGAGVDDSESDDDDGEDGEAVDDADRPDAAKQREPDTQKRLPVSTRWGASGSSNGSLVATATRVCLPRIPSGINKEAPALSAEDLQLSITWLQRFRDAFPKTVDACAEDEDKTTNEPLSARGDGAASPGPMQPVTSGSFGGSPPGSHNTGFGRMRISGKTPAEVVQKGLAMLAATVQALASVLSPASRKYSGPGTVSGSTAAQQATQASSIVASVLRYVETCLVELVDAHRIESANETVLMDDVASRHVPFSSAFRTQTGASILYRGGRHSGLTSPHESTTDILGASANKRSAFSPVKPPPPSATAAGGIAALGVDDAALEAALRQMRSYGNSDDVVSRIEVDSLLDAPPQSPASDASRRPPKQLDEDSVELQGSAAFRYFVERKDPYQITPVTGACDQLDFIDDVENTYLRTAGRNEFLLKPQCPDGAACLKRHVIEHRRQCTHPCYCQVAALAAQLAAAGGISEKGGKAKASTTIATDKATAAAAGTQPPPFACPHTYKRVHMQSYRHDTGGTSSVETRLNEIAQLRGVLVLDGLSLGDTGSQALAFVLEKDAQRSRVHGRRRYATLSARSNDIGPVGATVLLEACGELDALDLSFNHLGSRAGPLMTGMGVGVSLMNLMQRSSTLTHLNVSHNGITDTDGRYIAKGLPNGLFLKRLNLRHNNLGPAFGEALGGAMNDSLTELFLGYNPLEASGSLALLKELSASSSVCIVDLAWCGVTDEAAGYLFDLINGGLSLVALGLSHNGLGPASANAIARALTNNTTLQQLDVSYNPLTESGVKDLLKELQGNLTLELLNIKHVKAPESMSSAVSACMAAREQRRMKPAQRILFTSRAGTEDEPLPPGMKSMLPDD